MDRFRVRAVMTTSIHLQDNGRIIAQRPLFCKANGDQLISRSFRLRLGT